jgi:beta-glucosidase-like glycosyl hydrolase
MNAGNSYSTFWAPVVNLAREPRWGRNIETPGEDPYLTSEYATYFVQGFEHSPDDPYHIQASACCKHYVANSMEDTNQSGLHHWRNEFDAHVSQQDLIDSYMPPFQACVEKGKVSGLMCSYNAVNGVPSCASDWLLKDVARGEWGFDGYVTADCDADADAYFAHHVTKTPQEAVKAILQAGTDIDCGGFISYIAKSALDTGVITEEDINERLRNSFRVRMRLNHFDPAGPLDDIPTSEICSEASLDAAREGSRQGSTLIKNDADTLPLDASKLRSVAVIGPNADLSHSVAGYYGGNPCNNTFHTIVDAVKQYVAKVSTTKGVTNVTAAASIANITAATAMAAAADAVVMVVGTDLSWAAEGHDATSISFSNGTLALIDACAKAAKKPVVVITLTATPLDITSLLSNPKVGAILHAGMPSVATMGVGDVLFGMIAPAGRTIQTVYPASYIGDISIFDMGMRPGPSEYPAPSCTTQPQSSCPNATNPGRTHRFYTGKAVIPFGYGLSYTSWTYDITSSPRGPVSLASAQVLVDGLREENRTFFPRAALEAADAEHAMSGSASLAQYAVTITNTGNVDSDDVLLGFLVPPGAGTNGTPLQTLFGFERVHVRAGENKTVYIYPSLADFTQVDTKGRRYVGTGEYTIRFGEPRSGALGMGYAEHTLQATL